MPPENSNKRLHFISTIYRHVSTIYTYVCESKYLQNVCGKNDQTNRKNVSGKTMSNNCAESAWKIDEPIYTECVWGYDLRGYFKNLPMLCYGMFL